MIKEKGDKTLRPRPELFVSLSSALKINPTDPSKVQRRVSSSPVTMLVKWLAGNPEKRLKKRMKVLQRSIDGLTKELEAIKGVERYYLDQADRELELASQYGGMFQSTNLERKAIAEQSAKTFADMQLPAVKELALLERLKKKDIEALYNGDYSTLKKRHFCFLVY